MIPRDRLKYIIPNSAGMTFSFNGRIIDISKTIRQLRIPENGIITAVKTIPVKISNGSHKMVNASDGSVTSQLKNVIKQFEKENFFVKSKGRIVLGDELADGRDAEVSVTRPKFEVKIGHQNFTFPANGGKVSFQDFTFALSIISGMERRELSRHTYVCMGCRRRVGDNEEEGQLVNIECCRVRSLSLKVEEAAAHEGELLTLYM